MISGRRREFGDPISTHFPSLSGPYDEIPGPSLAPTEGHEARWPVAGIEEIDVSVGGPHYAGGVHWWATRPATPIPTVPSGSDIIYFSADTVVAAHQQYYVTLPEYTDEGHALGTYGWLRVQSSAASPPPTFTNHGLIVVSTIGVLNAAAIGPSTIQYAPASSDPINIVNGPTGAIYCENRAPGGSANGFYVTALTRITNAGLIQAVGNYSAYGIVAAATAFVTNEATGVIRVWGGDGNAGGMSGGTMDNRGLIEVVGNSVYSAVGLNEVSNVNNSGIIRVYAADAVQTQGLDIGLLYPAGQVINSGLIEAERAIWFRSGDGGNLNNSGVIRGDIVNGGVLTNTGLIEGDIFFADYGTVYHGEQGHLSGIVYLGRGVGEVWMGADNDVVLGHETGQNTISTGAGDDVIDIIGGTLTLDAGDGLDLLTFEFLSNGAVDVNLETHIIAGAITGTVRNVEIVVGGAGDDRLTGADQDDFLLGGAGADQLSGGAGEDFLDGGAGDDQLTSGAGNDLIFGGDGYDVLTLQGSRADYTVTVRDGEVMVKGPEGRDFLYDIELIRFTDGGAIDLLRQALTGDGDFLRAAPSIADPEFRAGLSRLFELTEHSRADYGGWEPLQPSLAEDWF